MSKFKSRLSVLLGDISGCFAIFRCSEIRLILPIADKSVSPSSADCGPVTKEISCLVLISRTPLSSVRENNIFPAASSLTGPQSEIPRSSDRLTNSALGFSPNCWYCARVLIFYSCSCAPTTCNSIGRTS